MLLKENSLSNDLNIDEAITAIIDIIWEKYDEDDSGQLDKAESKPFINEIFGDLSQDKETADELFENIFNEFDDDRSGTIDKDEMLGFVRRMLTEISSENDIQKNLK